MLKTIKIWLWNLFHWLVTILFVLAVLGLIGFFWWVDHIRFVY